MRRGWLLLLVVPVLVVGGLAPVIGRVEAIVLVLAIAATSGTAWVPMRVVRIVAPLLLGALLFALTRTTLMPSASWSS